MKPVYRIRRTDTKQFYSGGSCGIWSEHGQGASYDTPAACKCVWTHHKKYCRWIKREIPPAEIVELHLTEVVTDTQPL